MALVTMYDRHGIPIQVQPHEVNKYLQLGYQVATNVPSQKSEAEKLLELLYSDDPGGGGGGGGGVAPKYEGVDDDAVRAAVENQMVALLGTIEDASVGKVMNAYKSAHRQAWEGKAVDPNAALLNSIRSLESYKRVHKHRPDSARESTWVSQHRDTFLGGGGRLSEAEDRAIDLATVGATASTRNADLFEAAGGYRTGSFFDRLQRAAGMVAGRVA